MILLSNIIKANYIFYDKISDKIKNVDSNKLNQINLQRTSKEELYEIYNQREIIIKEANDEAIKIINSAKRNSLSEITQLKDKGYEDGYNAGFEIGKNKGFEEGYKEAYLKVSEELTKQNENKIKELVEMLEIIEKDKQNIIFEYKDNIARLSIDIAEKIIKKKFDPNDNDVNSIIVNLIRDYKNVEWVKIYISDKDVAKHIEADRSLINEIKKVAKDVKIESLKELDEGSLIIETPDNIVDASINTQLKNLRDIVLN
jgi:flagellar assembly protein FliH